MKRLPMLALLLAATACNKKNDATAEVKSSSLKPSVAPAALPTDLANKFDFCADAKDINFKNATYLAFFAANQYSHFGVLAPILGKLGFGAPGQALLWEKRWAKLKILRTAASSSEQAAEISAYKAKFKTDWRTDKDTAGEGTFATADAYEEYLVRTPRRGEKIQFFSGGELDANGAMGKQSVQVMWAEHPAKKVVIVAFRGTEVDERNDIFADLDLTKVTPKHIALADTKIHRGFYNSFLDVETQLEDKLAELPAGTTIWVTGHSLGAAVATVYMSHLIAENIIAPNSVKIGGMYNFGSPRVGDDRLRDVLNFTSQSVKAIGGFQPFPIVRIRNNADPVTVIPAVGYSHGGTLVYFGAAKDTTASTPVDNRLPAVWANDKLTNVANWALTPNGTALDVKDHSMDGAYFSLVKREYMNVRNALKHSGCDTDSGHVPAPYAPSQPSELDRLEDQAVLDSLL